MNRLLAVLPLILCAGFSPAKAQHHAAPDAMSMGIWNPTQEGECTKAIHDSYSAVNPFDGKRYPIWHPPVHPGSPAVPATATSPAIAAVPPCPFGHEHGMDPGESLLGSNI